jgi:hypothetical protein
MTHHKSEDYKLSAVEYYLTDDKTHDKLKENIEKVIKDIPKEKYENIFKGVYNRTEKYVKKPSNRTHKLKNYLP